MNKGIRLAHGDYCLFRLIFDFIFKALCLKKVRFQTADIPFCSYEMNGLSTDRDKVDKEIARYLAEPEVPFRYKPIMAARKLRTRLTGGGHG